MNIKYVAVFLVLAVCSNHPMAFRLERSRAGFQAEKDFITKNFDLLVESIGAQDEQEFRRRLQNLPNINCQAGYLNRTLAHVCAAMKALRFLRIIHDYEPDYSQRDRHGYTPLMLALEVGHAEGVEFLLPHSDVAIKNNLDQTVFELARSAMIMRGSDAEMRAAWQLLQDFKVGQLEQELAASKGREVILRAAVLDLSTRRSDSKKRKREEEAAAVCYVCCLDKQENGTLLKVTDHPCGGNKHSELLCRSCFNHLSVEHKPCPLCNTAMKQAGEVAWRKLYQEITGPADKKQKGSSSSSSSSSSDSDN